jgi:ubiquinone/menaquinone biosynthesis C-methylase UbiE
MTFGVPPFNLDLLVESQLNLQVKISYLDHHDFMMRHKMIDCASILDVGTGNGSFVARLSQDHPSIQFVGIDKRKQCVESCKKLIAENSVLKNLDAMQVDLFSRQNEFDFSQFDGFLMRYFLLHVDHSKKILELFKTKAKRPSQFWIIDLDFSRFTCEPPSATFHQLINLVKEFCTKKSIDSMAGQKVMSMLQELNYQNIVVEDVPFSNKNIAIDDFVLYLKQEVQCYSRMLGRPMDDPETAQIVRFINEDVRSGQYQVSYGMTLISAELN